MQNQKQSDDWNASLLELIFGEIEKTQNALPFRRFMELALYHSEYGYYASGRARISKSGDFITSVSVGCIYGRILASICREVWESLDSPMTFTIIEQGANDGSMAADLLEAASSHPLLLQSLHYLIVEPFAVNRERQQKKLSNFRNVGWLSSIEELPSFIGIHLSNELLDAFPVHALRWNSESWDEECVGRSHDELIWKTRPITDPELAAAANRLPLHLPTGFRFEVNLEMKPWLHSIHKKMERGLILTIDYGQAGEDRYAPHRADGTLLAYEKHQRFNDPLLKPGCRDITAQVDFTALAREAREVGFEIVGYSDQHHFLISAAEPWLRSLGDSAPEMQSDLRALQTLLHPGGMGMQFKAIAFGTEFPKSCALSCFKYQRPGVAILA